MAADAPREASDRPVTRRLPEGVAIGSGLVVAVFAGLGAANDLGDVAKRLTAGAAGAFVILAVVVGLSGSGPSPTRIRRVIGCALAAALSMLVFVALIVTGLGAPAPAQMTIGPPTTPASDAPTPRRQFHRVPHCPAPL